MYLKAELNLLIPGDINYEKNPFFTGYQSSGPRRKFEVLNSNSMNKVLLTMISILLTGNLLQAQTGNQPQKTNTTQARKMNTGGTQVSVVGTWTGTQTNDAGLYPQAFGFQLTEKAELIMTGTNGVVAAKGTYTFSNNAFNANYLQLSSNERFTITGYYDAGKQQLVCTQGSGTNSTGQGKITLSRVGGQVLTINNSNIKVNPNATVSTGIKTAGNNTAVPNTPAANTGTQIGNPNWGYAGAVSSLSNEYYLTSATVTIYTGADSKEQPACVSLDLFTNLDPESASIMDTTHRTLVAGSACDPNRTVEYPANSKTTFKLDQHYRAWDGNKGEYHPEKVSLSAFNQKGLTLLVGYTPRFILDAWKVNKVELTIQFKRPDGTPHPQYGNKVITFTSAPLLTNKNDVMWLKTDQFLLSLN